MKCLPSLNVVGARLPRTDAVPKTTGSATYTVDVSFPGMLHAKVLRSPHAHARVVSVDAGDAESMPGVHAVITRDDLGGLNPTYGYFIKDMPIVAIDKVRYIGDAVAAVAAETELQAVAALEKIRVEYELLPTVATVDEAMADDAPELFEDEPMGIVPAYGQGASGARRIGRNNCYRFSYETGDASAFDGCDRVFEDRFVFSRDQHFHLEPFVSVARIDGDAIEVWTSCQNPFPLRKELARVFQHPENLIRVQVPYIGAGYGAKNNCKTEPIAILLARKAGRPVRFCMTTEENFLTQCQHAAILDVKTGVMADGTFVARSGRILLDSGAYSDASPLVAEKAGYRLPRAVQVAASAYRLRLHPDQHDSRRALSRFRGHAGILGIRIPDRHHRAGAGPGPARPAAAEPEGPRRSLCPGRKRRGFRFAHGAQPCRGPHRI